MAGNKWTKEQWNAITEKDCNLLVAAAAGAGKTAVLVERIIQKISDTDNPVDIDRLLVVTFTNAAATEMRERIADAITDRLENDPDSDNIQKQLTLLGRATITTMHSFCLEVIRNNFHGIDIDPGFRIADETECSLMKLEALTEVFEEQYESADDRFFELLECYGSNRDDQVLQDIVLGLYNFIQSSPDPDNWLQMQTEALRDGMENDFAATPWGKTILAAVAMELRGIKAQHVRAVELLAGADGLDKYMPIFMEDCSNIDSLLDVFAGTHEDMWDKTYDKIRNIGFTALPRCGKDADKVTQDVVKKIRDDVKDRIKSIRDKKITASSEDIKADMQVLYPRMEYLSHLVRLTGKRYAEKKARKSVVDFNDLEHFCLVILSENGDICGSNPSQAALAYRERFAEIMVDEYQDSNLVQEMIIRKISTIDEGKPNVFMVGDVKQSIYRFRQARPELFLEKYRTYNQGKESLYRKILLYKNFRSRREVVDAVNYVFRQIMSASVGELDYTEEEALNQGADYPEIGEESFRAGGEAELHLIQINAADTARLQDDEDSEAVDGNTEEIPEAEEMLDNIQCEARIVAGRISELIASGENGKYFSVYDNARKIYRRIEYRDIVILLRTTRNWSDVFVEELGQMGIPAFADTGSGFFRTVEVQTALSLLQVIDNPLQDIPLLGVLRSPIVGFDSDDLADLRLTDKKAPLFSVLLKLAENKESVTGRKAAVFNDSLIKWRGMAQYMSTGQLLWQLYDDTGYYGMVGALPGGEQRQANLRMLFDRARTFEETSYKGLFNFIRFVEKFRGSKGDMGSAKILGENDNVVRIMSIHKSKGLEFPVVILAGCGKKFNLQDMNQSILLHQELGFGPEVVDPKRRQSWPSAIKQAVREKVKSETLSEEMRILYVALTRAREKLIITGSVGDIEKAASKWSDSASQFADRIPDYEIMKGGKYLDWIGPAVLKHRSSSDFRSKFSPESDFAGFLVDDQSRWKIKVWQRSDVPGSIEAEKEINEDFIEWLDGLESASPLSEFQKEIHRRLDWDYPYLESSRIPAKLTVTELKRRFNAEVSEGAGVLLDHFSKISKRPKFLEGEKGLTPAEAGTAFHFAMQHLDLSSFDYDGQVAKMLEKNLLTLPQVRSINTKKIALFFATELGKRMLAAESVYREVPFYMEISCDELSKISTDCMGDTFLLQGIIDCYFEEADGIVLLDYKTDYVTEGQEDMIRERYRVQIDYYARALKQLTGKIIKGKYIYLFWNGAIIEY